MRFVIDNNLSPQLAAGMKAFGEDVIHLTELVSEDAEDEVWLPRVGKEEYILITRDLNIRRRPRELSALREHKVGAFFLGGKNQDRWQIIQQVVRNWIRIKELAEHTRKPFAFRVPPSGTHFDQIPLT